MATTPQISAATKARRQRTFRDTYGPWALITGASDGIGKAAATRLAGDGLNVVLVARRRQELEALARELQAVNSIQTRVLACDLADPACQRAVGTDTEALDIGVVVLAAGYGIAGDFAATDADGDDDVIAVNISAVTRLAHTFVPRLVARGRGGMVLFGSLLAWQGVPGHATYAASKAFVQSLSEALHLELKPHGVDVLCVAPGPVHSGFASRAGMTMTTAVQPDVVAAAIVSGLGHRGTAVPGALSKLLTYSLAALPRLLRSRILGRVITSMRTP
jgi:short-subunit dehydrogenase